MKLLDSLGTAAGVALAPLTGLVAAVRRSRMFHPEGIVCEAQVTAHAGPDLTGVARRLQGPAVARFSSAWWKRGEHIDVLGLALRFGADQDLLLATVQRPITTLLAPFTTHVADFLENDYYGVSPFRVDDIGHCFLRVVTPRPGTEAAGRPERLAADVAAGRARLGLELALRRSGPWRRVADVQLLRILDVDQERLRFDPYRDGKGLVPIGFIHALRRGAYAASRRLSGRPRGGPSSSPA